MFSSDKLGEEVPEFLSTCLSTADQISEGNGCVALLSPQLLTGLWEGTPALLWLSMPCQGTVVMQPQVAGVW